MCKQKKDVWWIGGHKNGDSSQLFKRSPPCSAKGVSTDLLSDIECVRA